MRKILHTLYLRLDSPCTSLAKTALAQLLLSIIYTLGTNTTKKSIKKHLKKILNADIDDNKINEAIDQLLEEKRIEIKSNQLILTKTTNSLFNKASEEYRNRFSETVQKYFQHAKTDIKILIPWFEDVTIKFLNTYFYEWVGKLTKNPLYSGKKHYDLEKHFDDSFKTHKKIDSSDHKWLISQYYNFLYSDNASDNKLLWDFGTSLFSATLITANLSADQLSLELFQDSTIILDTNILLDLQLEGSQFSETFKDIEKVLTHLNIKMCYFHITSEEYKNKVYHLRTQLKKIISSYPIEALNDIDDIFVRTAYLRGCKNEEDIDRFIDQLMCLPDYFNESLEIVKIDNREVVSAIEKGQADDKLKNKINKCSIKIHNGTPKRKNPLLHDAGLISGVEYLREKGKYWILTLDNTLLCYSVDHITRDEHPIAFGLDTLINVLAINNGGVDINPENFAPLFSKIIKMGLNPPESSFQLEDLSYILDKHIQINSLPYPSVKSIASKLNKNRLIGLSEDKIALELNRDFQTEKLKLQSDIESLTEALSIQENQNETLKELTSNMKDYLKDKLISEKRDEYDSKIRNHRILFFFVFPSINMIILGLIAYINKSNISEIWQSLLIGFLLSVSFWLFTNIIIIKPKIISKYSERIRNIDIEVENEINKISDKKNA